MEKEVITLRSGKINDYLHLMDIKGYGTPRTLSIFLAEFDDCSILFDCGSSLDITKCLKYFKKNQIDLSTFKYLITTHHHFDHNGGLWKLYEEIKKFNPNVKILTNNKTKTLLNDYEHHLNRGRTTYGSLVGVMKPIEDKAFKIIEPSKIFDKDIKKLEIVENFTVNGSEIKLAILDTHGHTPDHQSPVLIKGNSIEFIFLGEAAGTIYHKSKLVTMPTSMPIYYNHEDYMNTIKSIKRLNPLMAGFGHFGVVNGEINVRKIIQEHESFMKKFKSSIVKYYNEKPKTRYIVEKIIPSLVPRTDLSPGHNSIFDNISVAIVYGMMISLGFRSIPKEEMKYLK